MVSNYQKVREAYKKFKLALDLANPFETVVKKCIAFIEEEFNELKDAVNQNDRV